MDKHFNLEPPKLRLYQLTETFDAKIAPHVRGAFHDNFPRFLGLGFHRKLVRMRNQQGTDKASKYDGHTVF